MTEVFYGLAVVLLIASFVKDKQKTKKALKKAWKSFNNILPQFLGVIVVVGLLLAVMNPDVISKIIGEQSGILGLVLSIVVGSITLIPGFIAFPTAAMLLDGGAGYMQIAAFVSALMMVGFVTIPIEIKYFGKKVTYTRNGMAILFSILVAVVLGGVMSLL